MFSPQGGFLTKSHVPTPSDNESMVRIGNHFYIKGRILSPSEHMDHVLAPVHDDVALPQGGDGFLFCL